jgi:hypothetical protein
VSKRRDYKRPPEWMNVMAQALFVVALTLAVVGILAAIARSVW